MKSALTIGNFDGVHRGHRALVEAVCEWKRAHLLSGKATPLQSVVVTFEPHPVEVLRPGTLVPRLSTSRERTHLLQNLGIDEVVVLPFTEQLAQTKAKDFFEMLVRDFDPAFVTVGQNFFFGKGREGTPGKLIDWCEARHIAAKLFDPVEADGEPISSTRIRNLIAQGQMVAAARLLGRDYSLQAEVVHGDRRGRQLGFPTANLQPQTTGSGLWCAPARGVYLSTSTVDGHTFPSITNVGVKPTIHQQGGPLVVETHLLDFEGDLYGKQLTVEFRDRLRDEQRFPNLGALTEQIQKDVALARSRLRQS